MLSGQTSESTSLLPTRCMGETPNRFECRRLPSSATPNDAIEVSAEVNELGRLKSSLQGTFP